MITKVGINGFGRIGRNILRALIESQRQDIEVVAINDLGSVSMNAHLLEFDSVHGRFPEKIIIDGENMIIGEKKIKVSSEKNPANLNWQGVDVSMECTGFFTDKEKASLHLKNGSKRVLISAPGNNVDKTIVFGVNNRSLSDSDLIVSNASCTTNCLAPIAMVINENFGIESGYMTTIHSYTGDQPTLDTMHKDKYRARSAALSMIPTSTGAAKAVSLVLPELKGKLDGSAIRVPTPNVSCVDLKFITKKNNVSAEEINSIIKNASETFLKNVLQYEERSLVSIDFNHNPASSCFAAQQTTVMNGNFCRVLSWYDNEWGFSNRMLDTSNELGKLIYS